MVDPRVASVSSNGGSKQLLLAIWAACWRACGPPAWLAAKRTPCCLTGRGGRKKDSDRIELH
eukprot:366526-Chlamydomonas_euryale.AAC.6